MDTFVYIATALFVALAAVFARYQFTSFRAQRPQEYVGLGPDFDLERHLSGALICEGVIFGPTGRMTSRFHGKMTGVWTGASGSLEVDFTYDDGARQSRAWHLSLIDGEHFDAEADDIVGTGRGTVVGPTVRLIYRIILPEEAGGHTLDVTDWMYLTENGTIINRSQFRKFGLKVAELIATIRPDPSG